LEISLDPKNQETRRKADIFQKNMRSLCIETTLINLLSTVW